MQSLAVTSAPWPDHNPFTRAATRLEEQHTPSRFAAYRDNPVGFVRDVLGEQPWSVQERILRDLWGTRRVVVPSCYASGKSWVAARAVLAWVATDPQAIAITTAPKQEQVARILWGEIRKAWRSNLPGKVAPRAPEWYVSAANWAEGMTTNSPERIQGFHEARVLVVIDEAPGVAAEIYEAISGLLASEDVACLLIGNPIEASGPFYDRFQSEDWTGIPISSFDTPNLVAGHTVNPKLVTARWVEERRREWGEGSPLWQSKVLGQFPDAGERSVIALSWFDQAVGRIAPVGAEAKVLGLDIARFGADDSAIAIMQGPRVLHLERRHGMPGPEVAGWAKARASEHGVTLIHGDAGGLGGPVLDMLRADGLNVVDVNAGAKPRDPEQYVLCRDEMWWALRQRFKDGSIAIHATDRAEVSKLRAQATALTYGYDLRGRVKVESKDDARKRGIPSPDLADALCLANYRPGAALAYLAALAPPCPACGTPNKRDTRACAKCGHQLTEER